MSTEQYQLHLPERPTCDIIRERLADYVERFNCEVDPGQRVFLHLEILELREALQVEGGQ